MKFLLNDFQKTALHIAVKKENVDIITLLLANKDIDVNEKDEILIKWFIKLDWLFSWLFLHLNRKPQLN